MLCYFGYVIPAIHPGMATSGEHGLVLNATLLERLVQNQRCLVQEIGGPATQPHEFEPGADD